MPIELFLLVYFLKLPLGFYHQAIACDSDLDVVFLYTRQFAAGKRRRPSCVDRPVAGLDLAQDRHMTHLFPIAALAILRQQIIYRLATTRNNSE